MEVKIRITDVVYVEDHFLYGFMRLGAEEIIRPNLGF
jgi:hypothetical protein